jgi:hypothetical protein
MPAAAEIGDEVGSMLAKRSGAGPGRLGVARYGFFVRQTFDHLALEFGYLATLPLKQLLDIARPLFGEVLPANYLLAGKTRMGR